MPFKFKNSGIIQVKQDLEQEIRNMLQVLEDVEKETNDLDDCCMGRGRNMLDKKFKEFHSQSLDMVIKTRKYTEFLDYLLIKYPKTDKEISTGLNKNNQQV